MTVGVVGAVLVSIEVAAALGLASAEVTLLWYSLESSRQTHVRQATPSEHLKSRNEQESYS
eukprot:4058628-Amphidinium_carterae.1